MPREGAGLRSDDYYYSMLRATYTNPITGENFRFEGEIPVTEATREEIEAAGLIWDPEHGYAYGETVHVSRDYFVSATTDQIQQWILTLREMDRNGEIPPEWYELVDGGLTVFTQYSNIIEINTFANVSNMTANAVYNYYTANEKDVSIENIHTPMTMGVNPPRYIDVSWTPIGDVDLIDPSQVILGMDVDELRDGAARASNNFGGETLNVNLDIASERNFR